MDIAKHIQQTTQPVAWGKRWSKSVLTARKSPASCRSTSVRVSMGSSGLLKTEIHSHRCIVMLATTQHIALRGVCSDLLPYSITNWFAQIFNTDLKVYRQKMRISCSRNRHWQRRGRPGYCPWQWSRRLTPPAPGAPGSGARARQRCHRHLDQCPLEFWRAHVVTPLHVRAAGCSMAWIFPCAQRYVNSCTVYGMYQCCR